MGSRSWRLRPFLSPGRCPRVARCPQRGCPARRGTRWCRRGSCPSCRCGRRWRRRTRGSARRPGRAPRRSRWCRRQRPSWRSRSSRGPWPGRRRPRSRRRSSRTARGRAWPRCRRWRCPREPPSLRPAVQPAWWPASGPAWRRALPLPSWQLVLPPPAWRRAWPRPSLPLAWWRVLSRPSWRPSLRCSLRRAWLRTSWPRSSLRSTWHQLASSLPTWLPEQIRPFASLAAPAWALFQAPLRTLRQLRHLLRVRLPGRWPRCGLCCSSLRSASCALRSGLPWSFVTPSILCLHAAPLPRSCFSRRFLAPSDHVYVGTEGVSQGFLENVALQPNAWVGCAGRRPRRTRGAPRRGLAEAGRVVQDIILRRGSPRITYIGILKRRAQLA